MKKKLIVLLVFLFLPIMGVGAANDIATALKGRILLQVEDLGKAWYVDPDNGERIFLGRPDDAFRVMRERGLGISNLDLTKIALAVEKASGVNDSDGDGLSDDFEVAIGTDKSKIDSDGDGFSDYEELMGGYNPMGDKKFPIETGFSSKQAGKVFLQVEGHGEAWYVNPVDNKRYFLGRPGDAFNIMRRLGLGISNKDIAEIDVRGSGQVVKEIEKTQDGSEKNSASDQRSLRTPIKIALGNNPQAFFSAEGDLRVFYSRMENGRYNPFLIKRIDEDNNIFSKELSLGDYEGYYSDLLYDGNDLSGAVLSGRTNIIVARTDNEFQSLTKEKEFVSTSYLQGLRSVFVAQDGDDINIAYGFVYNTGVFGAANKVYAVNKTSGVWDDKGKDLGGGLPVGIHKKGDKVIITTNSGVLKSSDNGKSYNKIDTQNTASEKLNLDDSCMDGDRIYGIKEYYYGTPGTPSNYLQFVYTDDFGETWTKKEILSVDKYIRSSQIEAFGNDIVVVWTEYSDNQDSNHIKVAFSRDKGVSWSRSFDVVKMEGEEKIPSDRGTAINEQYKLVSRDGRIALVYVTTKNDIYLLEYK